MIRTVWTSAATGHYEVLVWVPPLTVTTDGFWMWVFLAPR